MAWVATGASLLGTGFGIFQGINNQKRADKAQTRIDKLAANSPIYKPDKSIHDYYQLALNRYNENPYQSQQYQIGTKNIQRATAQGLGAMQDRRGGIGGASRLAEAQMSGMQNLGANAEAQKNARFGQYGQATQAKAGEDYRAFDINQMTPYKTRLGVNQMQMASANEQAGVGFQNAAAGVSNIAALGAKGLYKDWFA